MDNQQVSAIFNDIANFLALQDDDPFRIRAYRRAAHTISNLGESLRHIAQRNALEQLPGIGKTLAKEIQEWLEMGSIRYHEHLKSTVPEGLVPLLRLPSLTGERVRTLWRTHDIISMPQLIQAFQDERLPFDASTLEALRRDLDTWQRQRHRTLLGVALPRAETLVQNLSRLPLVERISLAGSLRRGADVVADINVVMASYDPPRLIHLCNQQPEVHAVIDTGQTSTRLITSEGLRLSLVAVLPQQFAYALLHHTGSVAHLTTLRRIAQRHGLQLTEHGLARLDAGPSFAATEEPEIYQYIGLPYIAPELREDRGEIDAAETNSLPHLVTAHDVLGDLHVQSDWGTGAHSLEDIALAARKMGYQYVAICDYVSGSESAYGLSPGTLVKQIAAIKQFNTTSESFRLLAGAEIEISADGHIELDDDILQELDVVIAAMHTGLKEPRHKITRRLCRAMEHPLVNVLAHPTGRMLGRPDMPSIDVEALIETAIETQTCLEINSHILRLDLPDVLIQQARNVGATFSLGSHAQTIQEMRTMRLGILTARRGWVEPHQLLNTLPPQRLLERLKDQDVSNVT
jgi:DNA polymerase (family 10)